MNCLFSYKHKKKYIFKCSGCQKLNVVEAPVKAQAKVIFDKNAPTLEFGLNNTPQALSGRSTSQS